MRTLPLFAFLAACHADPTGTPTDSGTSTSACAALSPGAPPITVVVVDETGAERAADRVRWADPAAFDLWETAPVATCAGGASPPCAVWELPADLPPRVLVAADLRDPSADPPARPECIGWGAIAAELVVDAASPQQVHLTLPTNALWCDDGAVLAAENIGRFEGFDASDCLVAPPAATGPLAVQVRDPDGAPASAAWVQWYWPPDSAAYDGDHDLACVSLGCDAWVGVDAPTSGDFYAAAMSYGPPPPDYLTGAIWTGYGAGPQVGASENDVVLTLDWTLGVRDATGR